MVEPRGFGSCKDEDNKRIVFRVLNTMERLAEGQFRNDIEGQVIVPHAEVDHSFARRVDLLAQAIQQSVDILGDQGLLVAHYAI